MNASSKAVSSQVVASKTGVDPQPSFNPKIRSVREKPPSARKRRQLKATLPSGPLVVVDERITTHQGRTYGALFSEPIPEPLNRRFEPATPVKSWKLCLLLAWVLPPLPWQPTVLVHWISPLPPMFPQGTILPTPLPVRSYPTHLPQTLPRNPPRNLVWPLNLSQTHLLCQNWLRPKLPLL
jgi:hypothetical protein